MAKEAFKIKENQKEIQRFIEYFYKHMNIGAKGIRFSASLKLDEKKLLEEFSEDKNTIKKIGKNIKLNLDKEKLLNYLLSSIDEDNLYLVYKTPNEDIEIPIEEESEGIKKVFILGMPITDALCGDKIIVFDELEVGFHPLLSRKIIEIFMSKKTKAQLLFTTHNTNLLDLELFRRDQIYFASRTEKTLFMTELKSLGEISGVRKSADIEKAYLEGKYSDAPTYNKFDKEEVGEILC